MTFINMKFRIQWYLAKTGLFLLKGAIFLQKGFIFLFGFLEGPAVVIGKLLFSAGLIFYKGYFLTKKALVRVLFPTKDFFGLVTNKYIVHAAIVVIALAVAGQNVFAYSGALGDYGKKSILFVLTEPTEEEEVGGLPINSDIEFGVELAPAPSASNDNMVVNNNFGFVGGEITSGVLIGAPTRIGIEYYVVQKGDVISTIADEFGIGINTLLWANNLSARSVIRPGDKLTILPIDGVAHTVKKGDTVASIAVKYKAEQKEIIEFNKLAKASDISVGQVLVVPGGKIIYVAPPAPKKQYVEGYAPVNTYSSAGALLWPVAVRRITQYFSWRHPAIDVGLSTGNSVVAAEAGTIVYAGWGTGYGNEVLIDHGNGMKTRYAHNSKLAVRVGDHVERGQTISYSGNTGWSTGPHLHFEVYVGNVRRNPLLYIK
jgi:murein DD-endopeptidase MepM/ murein hydrolase activator NlpD